MAQVAFHLWGLPEVDLLASSNITQSKHYYILESPLPLGVLGLNSFNHLWMFQVSYMFPAPALASLVLHKFLAEHVKGQLRLLILVAPCWMEAPWLPTVFNMLAAIPQYCPIIKDLVMDVSMGHMLKGLPYLHLTLSLSGSGGGNLSIHNGLPAMLEGMGRLVCLRGCTKECHSWT